MLFTRHAVPATAALLLAALAAPAHAQVQVSLRALAPLETFYLADLVPGSAPSRPDLLGITLVAVPVTGYSTDARSRAATAAGPTISLEITVARETPSPAELFRGTTDPFVLDQPVRHLTTRELVTRGHDVSITDYTVNDAALQGPGGRGGRLPAGTYLFTVTVRDQRGTILDSDQLRLGFSSPTRVALLSPGAPAEMAPPEVLGPTPRFLWSAQGEDAAASYRLRVVKVDGAGSAVEALQSGFPAWEARVQGTSALYPASSQALRLEPGATYAWQVTRELASSGGSELVASPIYWFRVGGPGQRSGAAGGLEVRWAALLRALGLQGLEGFAPVGATLDDGRPIPLDRLEELLAAMQAGEIAVLSVHVR